MKKPLFILSMAIGTMLFSSIAAGKDRQADDDYWRKMRKEARGDVETIEKHYEQVRDRVKYLGGQERHFHQLRQIREEIEQLEWQAKDGRFDPRYVSHRAQQLHDTLRGVQYDLERSRRRGSSDRHDRDDCDHDRDGRWDRWNR